MSKRKISAVKRYLNGLASQQIIANEFNISQVSVQQWISNWRLLS